MSKKLMMNNYLENGLMPVMDGLVCWLDGRDGKGTDTIWKDRSGSGNNFTLSGFTFDGSNGWNGYSLQTNFNQYAINKITVGQEYTMDFDLYVDGIKDGEQTTFFYFGDGNLSGVWREFAFRKRGAAVTGFHIIYNNTDIVLNTNELIRFKFTLIVKGNNYKLFKNEILFSEYVLNNVLINFSANLFLGCGINFDRYSKVRFNSIKIYNRALSESEIQQNYLYEQSIKRGE